MQPHANMQILTEFHNQPLSVYARQVRNDMARKIQVWWRLLKRRLARTAQWGRLLQNNKSDPQRLVPAEQRRRLTTSMGNKRIRLNRGFNPQNPLY